jgi:antitoxin ParD1/3/4
MNISLTAELEQLVHDKVKTGMYQTASEVIREGLRLLRERDHRVEALRRDVRAGFEAIEKGEFTEFDANGIKELAARINARGRKRLADEELKTGTR